MDEFISVDEALEVLFDKADMDDKKKLKRLFQYYSRGKIDFYVELLGGNDIYAKPVIKYKPKNLMDAVFSEIIVDAIAESKGSKVPEVRLLEGYFKLDRNFCGDYLKALLDNHERPSTSFHYDCSVVDLMDEDFRVWRVTNFADISCVHFSPKLDDLLIKAEQVAVLAQASKPQQLSGSESGERLGSKLNNALKRIEALEAALWVLANKREDCINKNTGKVVADTLTDTLMDHSFKFFEGLDENGKSKKPRTRSTVYGYICDALNPDKKNNN